MKIGGMKRVVDREMVKNDLPRPAKAIWRMCLSSPGLVTCTPLQCMKRRGEQVTNHRCDSHGLGVLQEKKGEVNGEVMSMTSEDRANSNRLQRRMVKNDLPQPAKAIWSMSQSKRRLVTCAPLQCKEKRGEQVTNRGLLRQGLRRPPEQRRLPPVHVSGCSAKIGRLKRDFSAAKWSKTTPRGLERRFEACRTSS